MCERGSHCTERRSCVNNRRVCHHRETQHSSIPGKWLAKQLQEPPDTDSAKHRNRQVVVPSKHVGNLAG